MQGLTEDVTLRPRSSRVIAAGVIAIAAVAFFGLLLQGDLATFALSAAPLALLGFGAWVLFWHPAVRVGPASVAFLNPLRTVEVEWPAIDEVQTRWSLAVVTARGTWTAWAAPKPTRLQRGVSQRRNMLGLAVYDTRMHDRSPRGTTELASLLVERQWADYRDAGLLGAVEGPGVTVTWHVTTIVVLALLVAGWALALSLH